MVKNYKSKKSCEKKVILHPCNTFLVLHGILFPQWTVFMGTTYKLQTVS